MHQDTQATEREGAATTSCAGPSRFMWAITAAVKQGFVRVERAGEALVGHVGPVFVSIYVVLVGTGMWIFFVCIFPHQMNIPNALQQLFHTKSPIHMMLALPGALVTSLVEEPASMLRYVVSTFILFYIAIMMIWSYYMVCTVSPGTVVDGLSKAYPEKRLGPGSTLWWRLRYQQAAAAANITTNDSDSPLPKCETVCDNYPASIERDLAIRYRFCKKCPPVRLETALALLPPDLRLHEKVNRRHHFLQNRQDRAKEDKGADSVEQPAPEGLFDDQEDEGQADISTWLGPDEAQKLVLPPKPERAHHCRTCKTCVLKYDHHCPWINQCVGLGNERYFILFMFWFGLGTMIFSYMGWGLAYQAFRHPKTWSSTWVHRILYLAIWAKALFMGLAVIVFAMWQMHMIARGETSVENQDNGAYEMIDAKVIILGVRKSDNK